MVRHIRRSVGCVSLLFLSCFTGVASKKDKNARHCRIGTCYEVRSTSSIQRIPKTAFTDSASGELTCRFCMREIRRGRFHKVAHLHGCSNSGIDRSKSRPFAYKRCNFKANGPTIFYNHCSDCHMSSEEQEGATEKKGALSPGMDADSAEQTSASRADIRYENLVEGDPEELDFEPTEFQRIAESLG